MNININSINNCNAENSIEQISLLVYEGFKSKFTRKLFNDQEVLDVITAFCKYLISVKPEKLFVSEYNGKLYGCLFLTTNEEKYYDLYYSLKKELSFSQCLRLILLLSVLSHKPQHNESYIDFLAVAPEFRNKGIGKALVSHCKNIFPKKEITLHVAEQNYRAYQLYNKLGFKIIKKQSSFIMELVVGLRGWRLMKWEQ
ncbi:N-acetyltransferase [Candidatus Enterococcus mansonii]|uniref:N-acetyltransferase domain-containing protein n=1 Tax=Candidatus Enterococcus mansonii TaxID=1834181 RepID=A0ABU8IFS1_9ENTE